MARIQSNTGGSFLNPRLGMRVEVITRISKKVYVRRRGTISKVWGINIKLIDVYRVSKIPGEMSSEQPTGRTIVVDTSKCLVVALDG